jgi:Pyruvate/2-oxoacid:ferredoxin oxidoreductase gamma subunit
MVGAASCFLPIKVQSLEKTIADVFSKKDAATVQANEKAFELGQKAVKDK